MVSPKLLLPLALACAVAAMPQYNKAPAHNAPLAVRQDAADNSTASVTAANILPEETFEPIITLFQKPQDFLRTKLSLATPKPGPPVARDLGEVESGPVVTSLPQ